MLRTRHRLEGGRRCLPIGRGTSGFSSLLLGGSWVQGSFKGPFKGSIGSWGLGIGSSG